MARILFLALGLVATLSTGLISASDPPNVLMIAVDDLRPMLGCYGDTHIRTPNIDRLAKQGVVFERAYCQYAKCGTSRLSLMTGLRPDSIGVFSNRDRDVVRFRQQHPEAVSIAGWFKLNGYETHGLGKIYHDGWDNPADWSSPTYPGREGEMLEIADATNALAPTRIADRLACPVMQSPDVPDNHLFAGRMTERVLSLLRQPASGPRFVAVGFRRPHLPFVAPKRYFDLYRPDASWLSKDPIPAINVPRLAWFNSDGYVGTAKRLGESMPNPPTREEAMAWNGFEMRSYLGVPTHGELPTALRLELLQAYAACISYVDAQIGLLLDHLSRNGELEKTIVVLWSDHGWHLGEKSAWGKMTNFEIATRVPFIVAGPEIKAGRTREIAELVDLFPTLCDIAKLESPPHLEGESLIDVIQQPSRQRSQVATSQYARYGTRYMGRALRTDRYRLVVWRETKDNRVVDRELYDHATDPREQINLAAEPKYTSLLRQLEERLATAFERAPN